MSGAYSCMYMHVPVYTCRHAKWRSGDNIGHLLSLSTLFYFLLFLASSGILNGFIVIIVFDFCMYSRLADPLGAGDPFSVS